MIRPIVVERTVEKVVLETQKIVTGVSLDLSFEEVAVLFDILGEVGGGQRSARMYVDIILSKIEHMIPSDFYSSMDSKTFAYEKCLEKDIGFTKLVKNIKEYVQNCVDES